MERIREKDVDLIKASCEQHLKFLIAERCHKVLDDNSRVTNIWTDATNWIEDFSPRSEKAGMEYLAWILLPDQFSAFLRKKYYPVRKPTSLPFPSKITTKLKAGSASFKACYF